MCSFIVESTLLNTDLLAHWEDVGTSKKCGIAFALGSQLADTTFLPTTYFSIDDFVPKKNGKCKE